MKKRKGQREELLSRLAKKGEIIVLKKGKSIDWIKRKQSQWRNYREKVKITKEEEENLQRKIIEKIPERKIRFEKTPEKSPKSPKMTEKIPKINTQNPFLPQLPLSGVRKGILGVSGGEKHYQQPKNPFLKPGFRSPKLKLEAGNASEKWKSFGEIWDKMKKPPQNPKNPRIRRNRRKETQKSDQKNPQNDAQKCENMDSKSENGNVDFLGLVTKGDTRVDKANQFQFLPPTPRKWG